MVPAAAAKVVGAYVGKRVRARLGLGKVALIAGAVAAVAKALEQDDGARDDVPTS
jgi:hypothetical protein